MARSTRIVETYLCLAASARTNEQTTIAFPTHDRTCEQLAQLFVRHIVRRRVILAVHLNLIDIGWMLQRLQDRALLALEQRVQVIRKGPRQIGRAFCLLPFSLRRRRRSSLSCCARR